MEGYTLDEMIPSPLIFRKAVIIGIIVIVVGIIVLASTIPLATKPIEHLKNGYSHRYKEFSLHDKDKPILIDAEITATGKKIDEETGDPIGFLYKLDGIGYINEDDDKSFEIFSEKSVGYKGDKLIFKCKIEKDTKEVPTGENITKEEDYEYVKIEKSTERFWYYMPGIIISGIGVLLVVLGVVIRPKTSKKDADIAKARQSALDKDMEQLEREIQESVKRTPPSRMGYGMPSPIRAPPGRYPHQGPPPYPRAAAAGPGPRPRGPMPSGPPPTGLPRMPPQSPPKTPPRPPRPPPQQQQQQLQRAQDRMPTPPQGVPTSPPPGAAASSPRAPPQPPMPGGQQRMPPRPPQP